MIYDDWGFEGSPFQQTSLPPSELGNRLLVGRDTEVTMLMRRIESAPKIAVLEGLNGIGKTSVVNVAAYRLYQNYVKDADKPLYIPCRKSFQLHPEIDLHTFADDVLMEVAQTLIEKKYDLSKTKSDIRLGPIDQWLNAHQIKSFQGGIWLLQGGMQVSLNTSPGFERSGFRKSVLDLLKQLFPNPADGGVICCIDNLELLQESNTARRLLEQLRDELFQQSGLCWVLCGALGITYGIASSPRLDGYLHRPIELREMDRSFAPAILTSRIEVYTKPQGHPYLPMIQTDFDMLYEILRGNLRTVLSYTDNYCQFVADGKIPHSDNDKHSRFMEWLDQEAKSAYIVARSTLTPKTLEVFRGAASASGTFAPGDFEAFGFNTMQNFRPYIKALEDVSLVISTQDDTDKRRKTIQVTPKGWLVEYYINAGSPKTV